MSKNFREFVFAEVGPVNWIGEDTIFTEHYKANYSIKAKSNITVLEIATSDLKEILHNDYKEYLHHISFSKQIALLNRIKEIM